LGSALAFAACAGTPPDSGDIGFDRDASEESFFDAYLPKTCQTIRHTNAQGTLAYDLAGYLGLADERYVGKGGFPGREVAFTYVPERSGEVTISLRSLEPRFDAALYVLDAPENDAAHLVQALDGSGTFYKELPELTRRLLRERAVADYFDGTRAEFVTLQVEEGQTYVVVVDSAFPEVTDRGIGPFALTVFDDTCPCLPMADEASICEALDFTCGATDRIDSCGRSSGAFDLFGNYHAEEISCGGCGGATTACDLAAHACANVPLVPLGPACTPAFEGDTRDGLDQFGRGTASGDFAGREKLHSFTPTRAGQVTVVLKSRDATFDGALYQLDAAAPGARPLQIANAFGPGIHESLTLQVAAGQTYYLAVDGPLHGEGAYAIEWRDDTCPCLALSQEALCEGHVPTSCGSRTTIDSCGRASLNDAGALHLTPCTQCGQGMCDVAQTNQCVGPPIQALVACEAAQADTTDGQTLFVNETWLSYDLVFAAGPEAYFSYTPATSGQVHVQLLEADFSWYLSIYDNTNFSNLMTYADYYYSAMNPSVRFQAEAGVTYYIVVDGETPADRGMVRLLVEDDGCLN
jgi:hypothetical protein